MTLRIAHVSDIHFGGENRPAVAACAEYINRGVIDLVVVSGDLTRFAERVEFEAAKGWLAGLSPPVLVTPGNHDAPYLAWAERIFAPFRRFAEFIGPPQCQTWRGKDLAIFGVNTARGAQPRLNWSKGQLSLGQATAAAEWFSDTPAGAARVVTCHHPLIEMLGGPMTARVWGGERGARIIAEAGVDLVLSGHIHAPFVWPYPFGDKKTYAVGAGTLSVRERGVPAGFNLVEIERATIRIAALGWTGSRFEPYRDWSVDRRQMP